MHPIITFGVLAVGALNPIGVATAALALDGGWLLPRRSYSAEPRQVIQAIQAAEESHRAETLVYLGCSSSLTDGYPRATPDSSAWVWDNPLHPSAACWRMLAVRPGPVRYVYSVVAGLPGQKPPAVPGIRIDWPVPAEPWYVVVAMGDVDGDGVRSTFVGSSFVGEIYAESEGE